MSVVVQHLIPGHEEAVERFLARHPDTSMFLRANLRVAGLRYEGAARQAIWVAARTGDEVLAVAAHAWNNVLLLQAPAYLEQVTGAVVAHSGRRVDGIIGPWDQVVAARSSLGLEAAPANLESREVLFSLDLARLVVPEPLARGEIGCRPPRSDEIELMSAWRREYSQETLGAADSPELGERSRRDIERLHLDQDHWLLESGGQPVSYSAFNARLPDCVQIGGVFTPPELRGRGFARAVVAGSLLLARAGGATRSILFTENENLAARRCYESIGFTPIGHYGILLFRLPHETG